MADYIDRQAARDELQKEIDEQTNPLIRCGIRLARNTIDELPSADAVEVQHGHWIESDADGFVCSVCRNGYRDQPTLMGEPMFEYCPVCGARMDGE